MASGKKTDLDVVDVNIGNVDDLFRTHPLKQIRAVSQRAHAECDMKVTEMRSVVETSYREMLSAADSIVRIRSSAASLRDMLSEFSSISAKNLPLSTESHSLEKNSTLETAVCLKILMASLQTIGGLLDANKYVQAKLLLDQREKLRIHMKQDASIARKFAAFLDDGSYWQKTYYLPFNAECSIEKLSLLLTQPNVPLKDQVEILLCLVIDQSLSQENIVQFYLDQRLAALNALVSSSLDDDPLQRLSNVLGLVSDIFDSGQRIFSSQLQAAESEALRENPWSLVAMYTHAAPYLTGLETSESRVPTGLLASFENSKHRVASALHPFCEKFSGALAEKAAPTSVDTLASMRDIITAFSETDASLQALSQTLLTAVKRAVLETLRKLVCEQLGHTQTYLESVHSGKSSANADSLTAIVRGHMARLARNIDAWSRHSNPFLQVIDVAWNSYAQLLLKHIDTRKPKVSDVLFYGKVSSSLLAKDALPSAVAASFQSIKEKTLLLWSDEAVASAKKQHDMSLAGQKAYGAEIYPPLEINAALMSLIESLQDPSATWILSDPALVTQLLAKFARDFSLVSYERGSPSLDFLSWFIPTSVAVLGPSLESKKALARTYVVYSPLLDALVLSDTASFDLLEIKGIAEPAPMSFMRNFQAVPGPRLNLLSI